MVLGHAVNSLDGQSHISIRVSEPGFRGEISPVVSNTAYHAIHNGSPILLDYSPHLHALYALESAGQRYILPGSSIGSDLFGSLALVLMGAILLPYPTVLMIWGWRDLFGGEQIGRQREMKARVAGLRASVPDRKGRTGLLRSPTRAWYGVALYPLEALTEQPLQTFAISQERYSRLHEGEVVQIKYSAYVHYVFALEPLEHE